MTCAAFAFSGYAQCDMCEYPVSRAVDYLECYKCGVICHKSCELLEPSTEVFRTFGCHRCTKHATFERELKTRFYEYMGGGKAAKTAKDYRRRLDMVQDVLERVL